MLLLIRWAVPEAINSTSPAGACSNFRMPFDKRKFSHYEYRSLYVRLRLHHDARSSNHSMVVLPNLAIAFIARCHGTTVAFMSPIFDRVYRSRELNLSFGERYSFLMTRLREPNQCSR